MKIKKTVKKFAEDNDIQLKDWQIKNLGSLERRITDDTGEDEVMDMISKELKKTGFFLKDKSYRDLKRRLF